MEHYIRQQIKRLTSETSLDEKVHTIDNIYALLEEEGYKREDIKRAIDLAIIDNMSNSMDELKELLKDIKGI